MFLMLASIPMICILCRMHLPSSNDKLPPGNIVVLQKLRLEWFKKRGLRCAALSNGMT